ncbi:MAG: hypothetical protein ACE15C_01245 [Phycisphaerae bacterium]
MCNRNSIGTLASVAAAALVLASTGSAALAMHRPREERPIRVEAAVETAPEVLTRGVVNEAFAEPVVCDPQSGVIVTVQPPDPIPEVPPAEAPEGNNVVWAPGYWSWSADLSDFVWVAGCWRIPPPGYSWVPGYWAQVEGGWEWTPGFWSPSDATEVEYLPAPPACPDEAIPAAPSADVIWSPGCWIWRDGRYAWLPGFWVNAREDWVWVPSHYCRTPRGYVFIDGYYDCTLRDRGILFAPCYFPHGRYAGASWTPTVAVDLSLLVHNLFCYPRYDHYCFGDYYDAQYRKVGIYPAYQALETHRWYDPLFVHADWTHRKSDPKWFDQRKEAFERRVRDANLRPARTYADLRKQEARLPAKDRKELGVVRPYKDVVADKTEPLKFTRLPQASIESHARVAKDLNAYARERSKWELPTGKPVPTPKVIAPPITPAPPERRVTPIPTLPPQRRITPAPPPVTPAPTVPPEHHIAPAPPLVHVTPTPAPASPYKVKLPPSPLTVKLSVGPEHYRKPPPRPEMPKTIAAPPTPTPKERERERP